MRCATAGIISPKQWSEILHVSVEGVEGIQVVGGYQVVDDTVRFTPTFPFDPGRTYDVWFDPARLPDASAVQPMPRIAASISLPRPERVTVHRRDPRLSEW